MRSSEKVIVSEWVWNPETFTVPVKVRRTAGLVPE